MKWIFLLSIVSYTNAYLFCNESQHKYFEREREMFGLDSREFPFEAHLSHYPTSCINDDGKIVEYPEFTKYMFETMQYDVNPSVSIGVSNYIYTAVEWSTNVLWRAAGWRHTTYNGEHYRYYENVESNENVVFFHGLNAMNGIENMYLLKQFTRNASVYVSLYEPTFVFEKRNSDYTHTFAQHVNNVAEFISTFDPATLTLVGNSYGTIRMAGLCKSVGCDLMQRVIMTDPLSINLPFSNAYKMIAFGVYVKGNHYPEYKNRSVVRTIRIDKHYKHALTNLDWYQWTIDSRFMEKHKHNLVLVIGDRDYGITVNKTSLAMTQTCKVVYIDAKHGGCLFGNVQDWI